MCIRDSTSLDGIKWRSSAESSADNIKFDAALWKRILSQTSTFLKDSHFTKDDISVDTVSYTHLDVYKRQPGWRVMHLLYLGGALGGAIVSLYQIL